MWFRSSLPLSLVTLTGFVLAASMFAQQVPNPVLPGPSGSGDGLTRDALDAAPVATPAANAPAPLTTTASRRSTRRTATGGRKSQTYATFSHHRRHRRAKRREATQVASASFSAKRKPAAAKPRAPLVSFIYWWNGWVVRTFHTRSGTVLLDTIGAKS